LVGADPVLGVVAGAELLPCAPADVEVPPVAAADDEGVLLSLHAATANRPPAASTAAAVREMFTR
jgi:hypothetical protein